MTVSAGLLSACSDDSSPYGSGATGKLLPNLTLDTSLKTGSRADSQAKEITTDDLTIKVTPASTSGTNYTCEGLSNFDTSKEFVVGKYTFEASYGDIAQEGFDMPAYYGAANVTVEDKQTTEVALDVKLINSIVTIVFDESLTSYATSLSATVSTTGAAIEFTPDQGGDAYLIPGTATVVVDLTKPNGKAGSLTIPTFEAKAQYRHIVKLALTDGSNDAALDVQFDDNTEAEDIEIELSDELLNKPAPVATAQGFVSGDAIEFVPGLSIGSELGVDISAQAGIEKVIMQTTGASLIQQGWPAEIDLTQATSQEQETLKNLGLDVLGLYRNPDRMAVLDFTNITKHIVYNANGNNDTEITLIAYDKASKSSEPVKLVLNAQALQLELEAVTTAFPEVGEPIELKLTFNGADPKNELVFQYTNRRGTWDALTLQSINDNGDGTYSVKVAAPDIDFSAQIRAYCTPLSTSTKPVVSNTVTVKQVAFRLKAAKEDVFATYAYLEVVGTSLSTDQLVKIASEGTLTLDPTTTVTKEVTGSTIKISGLEPGKFYAATLTYGDETCNPAKFTTEEAAQLPNANLDTWYSVKGSNYWSVDYPGENENTPWGTMNQLTTSEGTTGALLASSAGYAAKSGTTPVVNGSGQAALIQTVGWGKGNTAWGGKVNGTSGSASGGGACQHFTPGELYLGHCDVSSQKAVYDGYAFESRPASLQFQFMYTPKNSADWGVAEIHVLASDGTEIAKAETTLTAQSSYTTKTLELSYPRGSKNAAKIQVMFKSCGNDACLAINNDNMDSPPVSTTTSQGYIGSKLYIDDIQLNY